MWGNESASTGVEVNGSGYGLPFGDLPSFLALLPETTRASAMSFRWNVMAGCSLLLDPFEVSTEFGSFFCCTMLRRQLVDSGPLL